MQENDFEKQVQQKMEELQFVPSEPVWQKVEAQIRRKKERRRAIFLLLPLLLLGGGIAWYFGGVHNQHAVPHVTGVQKEQPLSLPKAEYSGANNFNNPTSNSNPATIKKLNPANNSTTAIPTKHIIPKASQKEMETFSKKDKVAFQTNTEKPINPEKPLIGKRGKDISTADLRDLVVQNEVVQKQQTLEEERSTTQKNVSKPFRDSAIQQNVVSPVIQPDKTVSKIKTIKDSSNNTATAAVPLVQNADSVEKKTAPPNIASKQKGAKTWEWTVTGRIGVSGARSQMLDVFTVESAADFYASPATGNTSSPAFSSSGSINNSTAFSLGAGVRKKMFQKAFVSAGLQYSQYRSTSMVGTRKAVDTTVNYNGRNNAVESYFDQGGSQSRYTTRFHYIELPLAFEYRLFKKVPLQLQHGISAGYLFSTNALYYDRAARIFYNNDEWLRKVGLNVFTSLDYRIWQAKKFSLYTGPQLQWGLTPLQQKREDKKHHQFFAGLQTRITF